MPCNDHGEIGCYTHKTHTGKQQNQGPRAQHPSRRMVTAPLGVSRGLSGSGTTAAPSLPLSYVAGEKKKKNYSYPGPVSCHFRPSHLVFLKDTKEINRVLMSAYITFMVQIETLSNYRFSSNFAWKCTLVYNIYRSRFKCECVSLERLRT